MTLSIIIISLAAVLIVGWILSVKKADTLTKKYGKVMAPLLASLAAVLLTLLGVYLPSHLSDAAEREDAVELLNIGREDVYRTRQSLILLHRWAERMLSEGQPYAANIARNEIPSPRAFLRLLQNEKVLMYMNGEMWESTGAFERNSTRLFRELSADSLADTRAAQYIAAYGAELWRLEQILILYIQCMEQRQSDSAFSKQKQAIIRQWLSLNSDPEIKTNPNAHPWLKPGT
ncbi:MAG: hypothetical protein OEW00_13105 [candidate division Zixibacteria bacterium]|nr:hypothetical protein [candidate division Zixibacteria bacterium]